MIIEGYIGKKIYSNNDFKVYSFYPINESKDKVILNEYNNITINGEMMDLIDEVLYKIDVEYVKKGKYDNYIVNRILSSNIDKSDEKSTIKFLSTVISDSNQLKQIMKYYPDIIDRVINEKPIDTSKLHGIGDKRLNKIKQKIIENFQYMDIINEFKDYGFSISMIKKLHEAYTSIGMVKKKIENDPYGCLCKINKVGFKTADKIILNKFPEKINSRMRAEACIFYILSQSENTGSTWISLKELYSEFQQLACESKAYFLKVLVENEHIYFNKTLQRVSLNGTYMCEKEVGNIILDVLNNNTYWDIDYNEFSMIDGMPLTEEQMSSLKKMCNHNVSILAGVGGSGKSFSVKAIIDMLDKYNKTYLLLSPTGKASKVLSEYTGRETKTIHRGLEYNPRDGFRYNLYNKFKEDVIIIDEFSMIDVFLLRDLLRAIDTERTKILFIGDPSQIPSVGVGNIAFDLLTSGVIPTSMLTKVFRYDEGGLSYVATQSRKGKKYLNINSNSIQTFGTKKDYIFIKSEQDQTLNCITTLYKNLISKGIDKENIVVLSVLNKGEYGTYKINSIIQDIINPLNNRNEIKFIKDGFEIRLREGDMVLQTKNNYKAESTEGNVLAVFNGDIGIVTKVESDFIEVLINGGHVIYEKSNLNQLLLAYSLSFHKSQGSAWKHIMAVTPKTHKYFLDRNLLYLVLSRAKENLYHIGTVDTVNSALLKSQNIIRNTMLKDFLLNKIYFI